MFGAGAVGSHGASSGTERSSGSLVGAKGDGGVAGFACSGTERTGGSGKLDGVGEGEREVDGEVEREDDLEAGLEAAFGFVVCLEVGEGSREASFGCADGPETGLSGSLTGAEAGSL